MVAPIPPLTDYPNHLARLYLLTGGVALPPVAGMYAVAWDTPSNIGIDLLAVLLSPVLGYEMIGRICVALATLLPPVGGVLLARVVHGRFHWWHLAFGLATWNTGLLVGLLNFQIGLGLALLAAAADPVLTRRGAVASLLGRTSFGILTLVVHPFAIIFYAALLGGLALGGPAPAPARRFGRAGSLLAVAIAVALPVLLLSLVARSLPGDHAGLDPATLLHDVAHGFGEFARSPSYKFKSALIGLRSYSQWLDLLGILALLLPVALALVTRRLAVHGGLLLACGGLVLGYLVVPFALGGSTWVDRRFALMATLAFLVCVRPDLPPVPGRVAMAGLLLLGLAKTGMVGWIWHQRQADVTAVYRALEFGAARRGDPAGRASAGRPWRGAFGPLHHDGCAQLPAPAEPGAALAPGLRPDPFHRPRHATNPCPAALGPDRGHRIGAGQRQRAHPARPYRRCRALCRLCRAGLDPGLRLHPGGERGRAGPISANSSRQPGCGWSGTRVLPSCTGSTATLAD